MKRMMVILSLFMILGWALWTAAMPGGTSVALAAPAYTLCNQVYVPVLWNGSGGDAAPEIAAPEMTAATHAECDGFPDFNGDGYADMAVGVPHKEVFDGVVNQTDAGIVQVVYGSAAGLNATLGQAAVIDQIWHRALGGVTALAGDMYGASLAMGDFNRDGYDDLAIGIPGANIDGQGDAGAVQVIYGSSAGLLLSSMEEWSRDTPGISGAPGAGELFGTSLAAGDFDGNGYADLAVGVPYASISGDAEAGAFHAIYGRDLGLSALGSEMISQDTLGAPSTADSGDRFGFSLAAGDFNGDGVDDLAVGTPFEDNGVGFTDAGSVQIFLGKSGSTSNHSGLLQLTGVTGAQEWRSDSPNMEGAMEANDRFGYSVAAGDFDGDGYDDLAVGLPFEVHGSGGGAIPFGGAINVIMGGASGLEATPQKPGRLWHEDSPGMAGLVEANEFFGLSLATGDFDGDGYEDLAIGVPGNQFLTVAIGSVQLMYGSSNGLTASGALVIYDSVNAASGDFFGWAVATGDFNGDGYADLVVGARNDEPVGLGLADTGSIFTFYSDDSGVLQSELQNWYPGNNGMRGTPQANDFLGMSLPGNPAR